MSDTRCDIAIAGGGLAGGLAALALARQRPDLSLRLVEGGPALGGNHRWSWFASDLDRAGTELMAQFTAARWDGGYHVAFPGAVRHLATGYRSLASRDFADTLGQALPRGTIRCGVPIAVLEGAGVTLASGERITARTVIDARGHGDAAVLTGGWQVFVGRRLHTAAPHGVRHPLIMDATVAQAGGYRFVYALPLGLQDIFLEDTYYQDTPLLDAGELGQRLDTYAAQHGWAGSIIESETGILPVITGGDFGAFQAAQRISGVAAIGARGGFVHPLTSYTLPFAVRTALAIAEAADLPGARLAAVTEERARDHWRATRFYRTLGAMLFAAEPEERRGVFQRFYRLPPALIERFYAGRSTLADRARILCGRPPVPLGRALGALTHPQPPLRLAA